MFWLRDVDALVRVSDGPVEILCSFFHVLDLYFL